MMHVLSDYEKYGDDDKEDDGKRFWSNMPSDLLISISHIFMWECILIETGS